MAQARAAPWHHTNKSTELVATLRHLNRSPLKVATAEMLTQQPWKVPSAGECQGSSAGCSALPSALLSAKGNQPQTEENPKAANNRRFLPSAGLFHPLP